MDKLRMISDSGARYVNLGCGSRYDHRWTNLDVIPHGPSVLAADFRTGIPLPDKSCDVVYHSHVLEHFQREEGEKFIRECYRVLRPGGLMRVVLPDLEQICRLYLAKLDAGSSSDERQNTEYTWIMLELFDQTVRDTSGGEMLRFLGKVENRQNHFVQERLGPQLREMCQTSGDRRRTFSEIRAKLPRKLNNIVSRVRDVVAGYLILGARGREALRIGRFRQSGEIHYWMYDTYSLSRLLRIVGFVDAVSQSANNSGIPGWNEFCLDAYSDGTQIKPDSLYLEARRP
jgi:predicted SAM-dependent methyltransferase